jgi:uncharacterized spore protein YtfJ
MDIQRLLDTAKDTLTVERVFGEPIERDGMLVIPVAVVVGGGGAGQRPAGDDGTDESGGGFGGWARPIGVYVVHEGTVRFRPAVDVMPLALGAAVFLRRWARRRRKRRT